MVRASTTPTVATAAMSGTRMSSAKRCGTPCRAHHSSNGSRATFCSGTTACTMRDRARLVRDVAVYGSGERGGYARPSAQ